MPSSLLDPERAALRSGASRLAGVDEAGRGPLAGPVVAAAVCFPEAMLRKPIPDCLAGLTDSKQLTARRRDHFFDVLQDLPGIAIGVCSLEAPDIDRLNILRATHAAMAGALKALDPPAGYALVDGLPVTGLPCPHEALVKGDSRSLSIAAASIIAKVTRDRIMEALDKTWPQYGFARHKGYGTRMHLDALREHGPCPAHRRSFRPVSELWLF